MGITGTPKTELSRKNITPPPRSSHLTNQQTELPHGNHRLKTFAYCVSDATRWSCSREGAPKQSDRKTKTSFDRAPPRRQHQGGPGSGRHQRSCGNFLVLPLSSERHLVALPDAAHLIAGARESFRSFVDGALTQDPLGAAFEEVLDQTMSLFFGQIVYMLFPH